MVPSLTIAISRTIYSGLAGSWSTLLTPVMSLSSSPVTEGGGHISSPSVTQVTIRCPRSQGQRAEPALQEPGTGLRLSNLGTLIGAGTRGGILDQGGQSGGPTPG